MGPVGLRLRETERLSYPEAQRGRCLLLGANKQLLNKLKKQLMDRFEIMDMGDESSVHGMNVTHDREEGTFTIN